MNVERMRQLKEDIKEPGPGGSVFNMTCWGTCLAGYASRKAGSILRAFGPGVAADWLDLTQEQADHLFHVGEWPESICHRYATAENQAANVAAAGDAIEWLIATAQIEEAVNKARVVELAHSCP